MGDGMRVVAVAFGMYLVALGLLSWWVRDEEPFYARPFRSSPVVRRVWALTAVASGLVVMASALTAP